MAYQYKIRSVDAANGTFVIEFDGLRPLNMWIPHNDTGFLTGQELEDAIQTLYPWDVSQSDKYAAFTNGHEIEALIEAAPAPALTEDQIRQQRDIALLRSDWTQAADAPITAEQKNAWATYRQALRDVPTQSGFPANVNWPTCTSK